MSMMLSLKEEVCPVDCIMAEAESDLSVVMGAGPLPKERLDMPEGQDAHFLYPEKKTLGVADGVGGWSKDGIDSGEYSRELMSLAKAAVKHEPSDSVDLRKVLDYAHSNTNQKGSSTACLITIKGRTLHALNVGDSGFRVLRNGVCVYRSPIQQSRFNCPYQLGKQKGNTPSQALALEVPVEEGDIVVAGTDGLFDNLWDQNIEEVVQKGTAKGISAEDLAWEIAGLAQDRSFNNQWCSPFEWADREVNGEYAEGHHHVGGKIDDITVVVAYIMQS